jgi:hypothetical protein
VLLWVLSVPPQFVKDSADEKKSGSNTCRHPSINGALRYEHTYEQEESSVDCRLESMAAVLVFLRRSSWQRLHVIPPPQSTAPQAADSRNSRSTVYASLAIG